MTTVFAVLLLASIVALIVGLIKPSVFKNKKWQNPTRKRVGLIFGGAILLFFILTGVTAPPSASNNTQASKTNTPTPILEAKATPTQKATTTPKPTPAPMPIVFDGTKGNNYIAANYVEKLLSTFGKSVPGLITNAYLKLDPQDIGGKSEYDYETSLNFGSLSIVVNADAWDGMSDSLKKDFVAGVITATKNNIDIYPSVTVSDGFRTVAEGSWNIWSGEANITLK